MGKYSHIDFKPPKSVQDEMKQALDIDPKLRGDGLESATVSMATKISKGEEISPEQARKGYRFWSRNERFLSEPKDSAAWVAAKFWAGRSGMAWYRKLYKQIEAADKEGKQNMNTNKLKQIDGRWYVYDHTGEKNVGKKEGYADKADAEEQLKAIEWSKSQRVNVVTAINASKIERKGGRIVIKDVVPIVDDIAMNDIFYPAMETNKSFESIEDTPAPIGHPMNERGEYISAKSGRGLLDYYAGAVNTNVRKVGDKVKMDVEINEKQAKAHPQGMKLLDALDKGDPIHVSTGLFLNTDEKSGEDKNGKSYSKVGRDFEFDHVAILLDEPGAATPNEGVGMFVNANGNKQEVEFAHLVINGDNVNDDPDMSLFSKFKAWVKSNSNLLANEDIQSMDMKEKIAKLKEKGKYKENMSDEEVVNAYKTMMDDDSGDDDDKKQAGNSEIASLIANAVQSAVAPLNEKITSLEGQLASNANKELDELADYIASSEKGKSMGMNKDMVKSLGLESAKTMAANCGYAKGFKAEPLQGNSDDKFNMELPE